VEDGRGERQTLAQAERQRQRGPVAELREPEARQQRVDPAGGSRAVESIEAGGKPQVLQHGLIAVQREPLRHVADAAPHAGPRAAHVVAGHHRRAGGRRLQPTQHLDERGLAGAVGAEEAQDLARAQVEADLVHRRERIEPAGEPLGVHARRALVEGGLTRRHRRDRARCALVGTEVMDEHVLQARPRAPERAGQLVG
jgi:hypothetical protein